jgi:hypothetical protein
MVQVKLKNLEIMDELKRTTCLSLLVEENEMLTIIQSGFRSPQMYYILAETAFDEPMKIEYVTIEELSKILDVPIEDIENKFNN